jgi:hypothetical protein
VPYPARRAIGETVAKRVLIACEFSGVVRDAFRACGHNAWSCDLLGTEREGPHIFGDVLDVMTWGWDLMVAHPPCTALCRAGDRWYRNSSERQAALEFVQQLYAAPIPHIAIENPRGLNRHWRQADQTIQPWMFGHGVFGDEHYCRAQDADKLAIAHGVLGDKFAGIATTAASLGLIAASSGTLELAGPDPESHVDSAETPADA